VSVHVDMNMKRKKTVLKVEFKQFQRLPEWPVIVQSTGEGRSLEDTNVPKVEVASYLIEENKFGIRSLAE
jgi:hypothetical protein